MKYFIDTEFIEGFPERKKWEKGDKKMRHFIDLISIGIFSEDGREYQAISNEYKYKDASDWVKENVILPLYISTVHGDARNHFTVDNFQSAYGKSNNTIAEEVKAFAYGPNDPHSIEFYGYYADYDWVLFCSLFGKMIDLPKGFPMYCRDLKQMLDECYVYQENAYPNETRLESWLKFVKNHPKYPVQKDEHNALADAKWNKDLYDFIVQKKFLSKDSNLTAIPPNTIHLKPHE